MANNIRAEGKRYQFLRVEDDKVVVARKKESGGLVIQASKTAVVVAHCPEGSQLGFTNKGVGVIVEYLESLNM